LISPDFSDASSLNLNGTASIATNTSGDSVLRLTESGNQGLGQAGTAFLNAPFVLGGNGTFSTVFDFQITEPAGLDDIDGPGADGITFVLQSLTSDFGGAPGGYLGYGGTDPALANSIAIEFDTFFNEYIEASQSVTYGDIRDPDGNHVGVDINGSVWSVATAAFPTRMNDGDVFRAWIDYSGLNQTLEVRLALSGARPTDPLLAYQIDLLSVLGTDEVFAGFTGAEAGGIGTHDILSWTLSPLLNPVPAPATVWLLLPALGAFGYLSMRRRTA